MKVQVNLSMVPDRHMLLHGGNILGQAHRVPKLVTAATGDVLGRSANERSIMRTISINLKAPGWRLHVSPLAESIAHRALVFPSPSSR